MINIQQTLLAMRADNIPASRSGRWQIKKFNLEYEVVTQKYRHPIPPSEYTTLLNVNEANLHLGDGDCVMNDTPQELFTHLNFVRRARGNVLVTGLGLGCVVRGLLCNDAVEHITIVERCDHVIKMVMPFMPDTHKIRLVVGDAREFVCHTHNRFDYAWHDLWSDPDQDEHDLAITHCQIIQNMQGENTKQGAWGMHRWYLKFLKRQDYWYEN